jgi:GNAT superfamily N-acetyltransferase
MLAENLKAFTLAERPELADQSRDIQAEAVPEFLRHDPVAMRCWDTLCERYPAYQYLVVDTQTDRALLAGHCAPLPWDAPANELPPEGWDWAMCTATDARETPPPDTVCALRVAVRPEAQGQGLATVALKEMQRIVRDRGGRRMVAPVRPNWKARYPLQPMKRYVQWTTHSGLPFDPWMRVHARLGGTVVKLCERSMRIPGMAEDWERWAGIEMPDSGRYVVPGALTPLKVDRDAGVALYVEPNVWMLHELEGDDR